MRGVVIAAAVGGAVLIGGLAVHHCDAHGPWDSYRGGNIDDRVVLASLEEMSAAFG